MSKPTILRRIVTGTFNYGLGNVLGKALGFLLIPVYTHYLLPEDYGILEICTTLSTFLLIVFRLGVPGSITRFYFDHKDNEVELSNYVKTVTIILRWSSLILGSACGLVLFLFDDLLVRGVSFYPYILLAVILSMLGTNSDVQKRLLQSSEKSGYSARLNMATIFLSYILAIICVVGFQLKVLGLLISKVIVAIVFVLQASLFLRTFNRRGTFKWQMAKDSLSYGLGIIPHHLATTLTPFLNRSILIYQGSLTSLGLYSLAYRFIQPLDIVYNMFNLAFQPVFFSLRKNDDFTAISNLINITWTVGLIIFSAVLIFFPVIIPLVTPERYHSASQIIPILSLGFLGQMLYLLTTSELFYNKRTARMVMISLPGTIINLSIVLLFVGDYNEYALAWGSSIGLLAMGAAGIVFYLKAIHINYLQFHKIAYGFCFAAILFLIIFYFENLNPLLRICAFIIFNLLIILLDRSILKLIMAKSNQYFGK